MRTFLDLMQAPVTDDRPSHLRQFYARYVTARALVTDPRIVEAFSVVPRERFAGSGPWSINVPGHGYIETPDSDLAYLYQDTLVAIDAARGINIGEPSLHARCLGAVSPQQGETVLHVGAGVGYYTAILAHLVGPSGRVHALEIEPDLAVRAAQNLVAYGHATVENRSGLASDLPSADVIYVNAGLPRIPEGWLDALRPDGRLIFPFQPVGGFGGMLRVTRPAAQHEAAWPARLITPAGFIGCSGGQDNEAGQRLAAAIEKGGWQSVRSLRRDEKPDDTCWLAGDHWWLSTTKPSRA